MKLFGWLRGSEKRRDGVQGWRAAWADAISGPQGSDAELRQQFELLAHEQPDVEVELEMLDALERLRALQPPAAGGALPLVETRHRVIGAEPCHFSAPASLPSDQAHASGRLLLTPSRAVFVGGGRTSATAWHAVHEIVRVERDVLFGRVDRSPAGHFRFNTYADAVLCAYLALRLKKPRGARL